MRFVTIENMSKEAFNDICYQTCGYYLESKLFNGDGIWLFKKTDYEQCCNFIRYVLKLNIDFKVECD